jgi:exonuclease SbcD
VWVAANYEVKKIETKRGPVAVGTAPYPIRARILEETPTMGLTIAQTDAILQEKLTDILDQLADEADTVAEGTDMPRLLTGHFTVSGAVVGSERNIMLGRDVSVLPSSLADPRWDYVALGHIHKHQNLSKGRKGVPPVVYSGSIERIDFGEEGDPKGFCWVELQRDNTHWRFVELDARPFVTLRLDLRASHNPTQDAVNFIEQHDLSGAVVRFYIQLEPDNEARLNESVLRETLLRRAGASFVANIGKEVEQPARARLGMSPEGLTHMELLERYLISKGVSPERRAELMDAAKEIFENYREN